MITREMIKKGFENGIISIEDDYAGCMGTCCKIGDNAFYFLGSEDDSITKEEYWKSYTLDMTIDMIFDILKSAESAEENGLDDWEIGYYESVLKQRNEVISMKNIDVKITYKSGRYAAINEEAEITTSCSIEQAVHDFIYMFFHNNPGWKLDIVNVELV